jgi:hypothetical protein
MWMAVHEAGHAVVADALGFRVLGTTSNAYAISVQTYGAGSPYIDVVVAMAGAVAQERFGEPRGPGSQDDFDLAAEAAADYLGKRATKEQLFATIEAAEYLADDILAARWDAVLAIASEIFEKNEMTASEMDVLFVKHVPERPPAPWPEPWPERPSKLAVLLARAVLAVWRSDWALGVLAAERDAGSL